MRCGHVFSDPESLYKHLTEDHIGRKTKGNLCLACFWKGCSHIGETFGKRDHVTSHLRIHVPLKPHVCELCKKAFKRPQDLRKHERSHVEQKGSSAGSNSSASPEHKGTLGSRSPVPRYASLPVKVKLDPDDEYVDPPRGARKAEKTNRVGGGPNRRPGQNTSKSSNRRNQDEDEGEYGRMDALPYGQQENK
ncbi:hypothetical protein M427DRAFT_95752 [Gonapodya prolifera JEL478]|uniref:C2H2-type domain-containing protein n=1 Tax=Gonapodya prolifera (strain JEL478) TaxID=1344416 RepID=A0A139APZ0_GONPJ|nr:hypothetical protein M427DRAFT_95752 [Gonapodya prolifera JEL478]|eukprot:KXS18810.1 hypothetical protein M427DRAFT_95752 [Gonapodya prolifera JEL478]